MFQEKNSENDEEATGNTIENSITRMCDEEVQVTSENVETTPTIDNNKTCQLF